MKDVIIGSAVARNGLFLAPMAGFTDAPFRALCRLYGATYTVSEMISAAAMHFGDRRLSRAPARRRYADRITDIRSLARVHGGGIIFSALRGLSRL